MPNKRTWECTNFCPFWGRVLKPFGYGWSSVLHEIRRVVTVVLVRLSQAHHQILCQLQCILCGLKSRSQEGSRLEVYREGEWIGSLGRCNLRWGVFRLWRAGVRGFCVVVWREFGDGVRNGGWTVPAPHPDSEHEVHDFCHFQESLRNSSQLLSDYLTEFHFLFSFIPQIILWCQLSEFDRCLSRAVRLQEAWSFRNIPILQ